MEQMSRLRKGKLVDINCDIEVAQRDASSHRTNIEKMQSILQTHKQFYEQLDGTIHVSMFQACCCLHRAKNLSRQFETTVFVL